MKPALILSPDLRCALNRYLLTLILLILLQSGGNAAPLSARAAVDHSRLQTAGRRAPGITRTSPVLRYAVNAHPLQPEYDHAGPSQVVNLALSIGVRLIRIDIHWAWIEWLGPGQSNWNPEQIGRLESFLETASRHGVEVLATVTETPCWASSDPGKVCTPRERNYDWRYPPNDARDFAAFVGALVERYHDRIRYWEIWNEPNLPHLWHNPDAAKYTELLIAAYDAVKQRDPTATVIGGALGPRNGDAQAPDTLTYLDGMYAAGARGHFDALSFHPYTDGHPPDWYDPRWPMHGFANSVPALHQRMLDHGDEPPIWLTEFGWTTVIDCDDCWTPSLPVSEAEQANYLLRALTLVHSWPYVTGAAWYELVDRKGYENGRSYEDHFGLYRHDLSPKPSAATYRTSALPHSSYLPLVIRRR